MANKSAILVLAFDIYGTLLDTNNITLGIQTHIGLAADKAAQLSQTWRKYQLEYTWRLNSMGLYEPFNVVTRKSLQHAAAELELTLDDKTIAALMDAYSHLLPFDDSVPALVALARLSGLELVIFSNGTHEMVSTALKASLPQNFSSLPLYLAESVRRYKPAPEIYHGLRHHVNKLASESRASSGMPDVWLVSGNPFDVTGARAAGLGAIWVDRARTGWKDQIPLPHEGLGPMKIVHNLGEIATLVGNSQLALSTV
ncbi:hypothetical protein AcV5_003317 [Taiwanofungus camphoratus]|nr:hypothetical protein AcV5_003317 [Antrodia cinnamomea]